MARISRRNFLRWLAVTGTLGPWQRLLASDPTWISKAIPSSKEAISPIGLGSSITFNVGDDTEARDSCARVMQAFFAHGGRLIDSSPMYGSSQEVIGYGLEKIGRTKDVFSADKIWTPLNEDGPEQETESRDLWRVPRFDLLQVHNLVDWQDHLAMLAEMKAAGSVRYVGITTSHGRRHRDFEQVMRSHSLDFIQLSYNIRDRAAEQRILPLARERGIAVIANRPFRRGALIDWAKRHPLPAWAAEIDCANWAQFLLKFIISHPALTCTIPATTRVDHVIENLGAARGRLPDAALRRRMVEYVEGL